MNITYASKIVLPLTSDSIRTGLNIEVDGHVDITHPQYAQEDFQVLREEQALLNSDLTSIMDQLKDLNSPFEMSQRSFRQPSHQQSFHNQSYQPTPAIYNSPPFYQEEDFGGMQAKQGHQPINVNAGMQDQHMYNSNNEECDFNSKSLVTNIHYLLIIYLVVAIFFCVKRSMFLDVTIAISFLAIIYRHDLSNYHKNTDFLKLYIGLFVVSASVDLGWLIVFFPSWNRDITSEDKGAQSILRIIILGGSLLFMIYKVLVIVAVIFLNKDLKSHGFSAHQTFENFLAGKESRHSHAPANPKQF